MIKAAIHHISADGVGEKIGYITLSDTERGLALDIDVRDLPPGKHGFHIHEFGDIEPKDGKAAGMAGQHYDPDNTGKHLGPYRDGHKGDLPVLHVARNGRSKKRLYAPRLTLEEVKGRALIIHSGGDNYSDTPVVNGGGKSRIAGGVITNSCPYCKPQWPKYALGGLALYYIYKRRKK